jgi:hypothetical protein
MLIHYSIASFEVLERKLDASEKEEVFNVFYRVGCRMKLKELPVDYKQWAISYAAHLKNDLQKSEHSIDLFKQYKKHLGNFRYWLLLETQKKVVPGIVSKMLDFGNLSSLEIILPFYKLARIVRLDSTIRSLILPTGYKEAINALDR